MPELAAADLELDAAEPVRLDRDTGPVRDLLLDQRGRSFAHLRQDDADGAIPMARIAEASITVRAAGRW